MYIIHDGKSKKKTSYKTLEKKDKMKKKTDYTKL